MSTINIGNRYTNVKIIVKNVNCLLTILIVIFNLIQNVSPEENDPQQQVEYAIPSNLSETSLNTLNTEIKTGSKILEVGFIHGFIASFSVIIVSEIGDKTFFIAAIMAMRNPRLTVFLGALGALGLMTVLSAVFGLAANFIPRIYTYYISTALFAIFGLKMLREGYYMSATEGQDELEEVQMDLRKRENEMLKSLNEENKTNRNEEELIEKDDSVVEETTAVLNETDIQKIQSSNGSLAKQKNGFRKIGGSRQRMNENSSSVDLTKKTEENSEFLEVEEAVPENEIKSTKNNMNLYMLSRIFMQAFSMTFVAEWGDRSQLTTIILAARENIMGVILGGVIGHAICTGIAVVGGRLLAQKISVRTVTLVGGVVFIIFAISALFISPYEDEPKAEP